MKRPIHISIGRMVLPARFQGQERAFTEALTHALRRQASGSGAIDPVRSGQLSGIAAKTADAMAQRIGKRWFDE